MYSIYNRSIPISFQNTLYCGTESKQSNTEQIQQTNTANISENHNCFYIALLLLFLLDCVSLP
ncbi:hypothetical protein AAK894_10645 [Lachnospiraceae bacterium 46-61]